MDGALGFLFGFEHGLFGDLMQVVIEHGFAWILW
jgi:hypothetical protein